MPVIVNRPGPNPCPPARLRAEQTYVVESKVTPMPWLVANSRIMVPNMANKTMNSIVRLFLLRMGITLQGSPDKTL